MKASHVELAARNNAIWCDTVCRAHGVPGEFLPTVWLNRSTPPPYHSNLIVISDSGVRGQSLEHIRELIDLPLPGKWSAKDSFFNLELATLGFDVLFEASWIWCDQALRDSGHSSSGIYWSRIASPAELARWESAWEGNSRNPDAIGKPAQFPSSLLEDRQVAFIRWHTWTRSRRRRDREPYWPRCWLIKCIRQLRRCRRGLDWAGQDPAKYFSSSAIGRV